MIKLLIACVAFAAAPPREDYQDISGIHGVKIDLRYASSNNFMGQDLYGGFKTPYLHKIAAAKLRKAAELLQERKPGWELLIFDALRPRSIQRLLWEKVKGTPQEPYVANPKTGSIHNYGFAVDLTLLDDQGKELNMGTPFDDFRDLAQPRYEEKFLKDGTLTVAQAANRKLLRSIMEDAGFQPLPLEWWHYDALPKSEVKSRYKIVE